MKLKNVNIKIIIGLILIAILCVSIFSDCQSNKFEEYTKLGNKYYNEGDYKKSIECYNKAINVKNNDAETYVNRGIVKNFLQDFSGALSDFNVAIKLSPDNPDYFVNRGFSKKN